MVFQKFPLRIAKYFRQASNVLILFKYIIGTTKSIVSTCMIPKNMAAVIINKPAMLINTIKGASAILSEQKVIIKKINGIINTIIMALFNIPKTSRNQNKLFAGCL